MSERIIHVPSCWDFFTRFTINWYKTSLLTLDKLLGGQGGRVTLGPFKYPYNRTMVQKNYIWPEFTVFDGLLLSAPFMTRWKANQIDRR